MFGKSTKLGAGEIETLLLLMMRNATTDSPWPLSNNPYARYNDLQHASCNLHLPLWQLVRASTAAPTFFEPELIKISGKNFCFVDGGVTVHNNPAFQMFLMATVDRFWQKAPAGVRPWETGTDKMLIVSIGTGTSRNEDYTLSARQMHLLFNAKGVPAALMNAALIEQEFLCGVFGECVAGDGLDRELGYMIGSVGPLQQKLFRFMRYNADLSVDGLRALDCDDIQPEAVQKLDSVDSIDELLRVGTAVGEKKVKPEHFNFGVFRP